MNFNHKLHIHLVSTFVLFIGRYMAVSISP